ncbi:MAG TPA: hypothetical protein VJB99_03580 [Patescibacteria group bacterium]|nr:hypothetical protein [Patescibacteria group bacterium]
MSASEASNIEGAVFRTLAWFSLFDQPLTVFDIWKWLMKPGKYISFGEVDQALEGPWLLEKVDRQDGRIFLKDGATSPFVRLKEDQARLSDAARKWKTLRRAARWFGLFPWVRGVAACNSLAWYRTGPQSDIDLFILVKPGTVWISRICTVLPFFLARRRPGTRKGHDPFCFSFFRSTKGLSLEELQWKKGEDPYLAFWIRSLVPVFDRGNIFSAFQQANTWVSFWLPHADGRVAHSNEEIVRVFSLPFPPVPAFLERLAKGLQWRCFPRRVREMANQDTCVVITDDTLKFHVEDDREALYRRWKEILYAHGVSEQ